MGHPAEAWCKKRTCSGNIKKGPLPASLKPIVRSYTFFCKRQDGKYFRFCGPQSLSCNSSIRPLQCRSSHRRESSIYRNRQPATHWGPGHRELTLAEQKHQPCAAAAKHTWSDRQAGHRGCWYTWEHSRSSPFLSTYYVLGIPGRTRHSPCSVGVSNLWEKAALEMDVQFSLLICNLDIE